nr:hypothetical protein OG781_05110 [Streptomyces sp. NBC_00830]
MTMWPPIPQRTEAAGGTIRIRTCLTIGGRWTEHHTVFVHVDKWGDLPRAQKLAAHIGSEVLGEPQLGW